MSHKGKSIYTLAETGTIKPGQKAVIVHGNGSDLNNIKVLQGRAKRKTITGSMALNLADIARGKGEQEKEKSYWNTYYCQSTIITANGKLYGNYCKNRFCNLCCSIRKAEIINRYYPVMKQWEEPYFVTLTVKSCPAHKLKFLIGKVLKVFNRIKEKHKKRHQRGTGTKLVGVKSLECNFNPLKKTYNPHLHIIVANKEMAEILVNDWLKIWPRKYADKKAQKIKRVYDLENNLVEIIKYGSKIFTEPDVNKKSKTKGTQQIYAAALDNILTAMKGRRIFDRFGFNLPKQEKPTPKITMLKQYEELEFNPKIADWQNVYSGEVLSGYTPPSQLTAMLEHSVNTTLE